MLFLVATVLAAAPIAEAGLGVMAYEGDTVILNGSGSSDPDGSSLTYAWTQVSGAPVQLEKADTERPEFEVDGPGTLRFELVVNDGFEVSLPDQVVVVVPDKRALPAGEMPHGCTTTGVAPALLATLLAAASSGRRRR